MIVPAAGAGRRLGGGVKALHLLAGRALLAHALEAIEANRCTAAAAGQEVLGQGPVRPEARAPEDREDR